MLARSVIDARLPAQIICDYEYFGQVQVDVGVAVSITGADRHGAGIYLLVAEITWLILRRGRCCAHNCGHNEPETRQKQET